MLMALRLYLSMMEKKKKNSEKKKYLPFIYPPSRCCIFLRLLIHVYMIAYLLILFAFFFQSSIQIIQTLCIDVLQAEDQANKFFFYEVYEDAAAIAHHKEQPHYAAWGTFKESGGTISSVSKKASGKFMT
jgi:hypothetical protein